jgi:hypothetical protein
MLKKDLPPAFAAQFLPGTQIAFASIPVIRQLEDPLRMQVQAVFAGSMAVVWQTMTGFAGLGFILSLFMLEVPMSTAVDESYALKEKEKDRSHGGANGEVL